VSGVCSIDALVELDPDVLDNGEVKAALVAFAEAHATFQASHLAMIATFERRGLWLTDGMVNAKSWLMHHTGAAGDVAGAQVWLSRRLREMPLMAAALAEGRSSEAHARHLARCVGPRTWFAFERDQEFLVSKACALTADDFALVVAKWLVLNDLDGPEPKTRPSELKASRYFDGRVKSDGDFDVDDGAEYLAELEYLTDLLWWEDQAADDGDPLKNRTHAQRVAAAQVLMARRSSAIDDREQPDDDGEADGTGPKRRPPRSRELLVIVNPDGTAELEDRSLVPKSLLDRWACDASVLRVAMDARSIPIDVSENTYTPSRAQRRALTARDRGCIIPGCHQRARWCQAHHVTEWPGGKTKLDNLVLLCDRHHKQIHNGHLRLEPAGPQRWTAVRPDGTPLLVRPPPTLVA